MNFDEYSCDIYVVNKCLKIPKGNSEIKVIRRRIDNKITTRKG
jgi:hypothetical protein